MPKTSSTKSVEKKSVGKKKKVTSQGKLFGDQRIPTDPDDAFHPCFDAVKTFLQEEIEESPIKFLRADIVQDALAQIVSNCIIDLLEEHVQEGVTYDMMLKDVKHRISSKHLGVGFFSHSEGVYSFTGTEFEESGILEETVEKALEEQ